MKKRAAITVRIAAAFAPVALVGVGVGVGFGWPLGLVAAGALLWFEDTVLTAIGRRSKQ